MDAITGASKETVNGVKFTLIYNAVPTFVELGATSRAKSKSLRDVARKNSSRYCLRFSGGKHEFYYFSPKPGISIARQIEVYIESSDNSCWKDDIKRTVIIALDRRIYIAVVDGGDVIAEQVLIPEAAQKTIMELRHEGKPVFCCAGGVAEIDLLNIEKLEDFDLVVKKSRDTKSFCFVSLPMLMARMGLYHQSQTMVMVPMLIMLLVVGYVYLNHQSDIEEGLMRAKAAAVRESARLMAESKEHTSKSEANHSASVNLIDFLGVYQKSFSMPGVESVAWNRESISIKGKSTRLPAIAAQLTDSGGWVIAWGQKAHVENKSITTSTKAMRESLFSLAGVSGGIMDITKTTNNTDYETVAFSLAFSVGVPAAITLLSNEMKNKPYRIDSAICQFVQLRPAGCQITMTAKYPTYQLIRQR